VANFEICSMSLSPHETNSEHPSRWNVVFESY
jgi:hypothetical protein